MILRHCHRIQCICSAVANGGARCFIYSLFVFPLGAFAQVATDTMSVAKDTTENVAPVQPDTVQAGKNVPAKVAEAGTDTLTGGTNTAAASDTLVRTVSFRPEDVQLQGRYRPCENDTLFPSQWWRRLYLGVGGAFQWLSDNAGSKGNTGFNVYLGYKFSPVHSLRSHGSMTTFEYGEDRKKSKSIGVGVDYLANLTNFAWGYDRTRLVDVSTVVGVGMRLNRGGFPAKYTPYGYIGAHADLHLSSNFALFVEPYVGMHGGMDALFGRPNRENWDLMYGANVGLQMTMDRRADNFVEADSIYRHFFFDSSVGIVLPGKSGGIMHQAGHGYQMAVGMWLNPMLGLRLGAQAQTSRWSFVPDTWYGAPVHTANNQALMSGRVELLLNPFNFFKKWRNAKGGHAFDFNLMAGGDFGWYTKAAVPNTTDGVFRCYYYGVTGAAQLLYRISNPGTYIFIEPRYLAAMYNVPYLNTHNSQLNVEHNFSLNIGTRVYMTGVSRGGAMNDEFQPRWWVGLDVGGVKWQRARSTTTGGAGINPSVGISVGYDWKRLASFRAQLAYQRLYDTHASSYVGCDYDDKMYRGSGLWNTGYDLLDIRLAYMLNLNNAFQGYNSDRRFNLWLTAGPTFSCVANQSDTWVKDQQNSLPAMDLYKLGRSNVGKASPGVAMSLMAALRVASRFDVTAEAMGQYNFIPGVNPGNKGWLNSIKYGLTVGTRYYFDEDKLCDFFRATDALPWQKGWELDASYGWALPLDTKMGMHASGCNMTIAAGYWFNSLLGARIGLVGQQTYFRKQDVAAVIEPVSGTQVHVPYSIYHAQLMLGGRAEVMLNPLNLLRSRREAEVAPRWDMMLSAGMNFGGMHKTGSFKGGYVGFTASAAALYRLSDQVQLYLEPRYDVSNYSRHNEVLDCSEAFSDRIFTVSVGTRITRPVGESRESKRPASPDERAHRGLWVAGGVGGSKMIQSLRISTGGTSIQPSIGISAGYDLTRLSGFRANFVYDLQSRQQPNQPYAVSAAGMERRYRGTVNTRLHQMDMQLLYMLNLTNLWTGYDKRNAFNMYFEAGTVFSTIMAQGNSLVDGEVMGGTDFRYLGMDYSGKFSCGLVSGLLMAMPVTNKWDITAEVIGQYYFNHNCVPKTYPRFFNDIKITFGLGTRYNF